MPKFEINYGRDMPEEEEEDEEEDAAFFQALGYLIKSQVPEDNGGVVYSVKPDRLKDATELYEVLQKTVKGDNVKFQSEIPTELFEMGLYAIMIEIEGDNFEITDPKLLGKTINKSNVAFAIEILAAGCFRFSITLDKAVERIGEIDE